MVYRSIELKPITVYGVLVNRGRGLELAELELFRERWGYDFDSDADLDNSSIENVDLPDDTDDFDPGRTSLLRSRRTFGHGATARTKGR